MIIPFSIQNELHGVAIGQFTEKKNSTGPAMEPNEKEWAHMSFLAVDWSNLLVNIIGQVYIQFLPN